MDFSNKNKSKSTLRRVLFFVVATQMFAFREVGFEISSLIRALQIFCCVLGV